MSNVMITLTDAQYSQMLLLLSGIKAEITEAVIELERDPRITASEVSELFDLRGERLNIETLISAIHKGTTLA